LGDTAAETGFAKGLYFGQYLSDRLPPYPNLTADARVNDLVAKVQSFCQETIDPVTIDAEEEIPPEVVSGLGRLGVLGACLPESCGGLGLSQTAYCRILEVLGGHCASTALFVNAHHSIGPRALALFGTDEQKAQWIPKLASGEWISAFALTEPEAGSDAGNVQTMAQPTDDGSGYLLNGEKRYITNGAIAKALTVMARTPVPGSRETKVTAFLVTPEMKGFRITEDRMPKCGVRGTVTSRLAFRDMFVPQENVLGQLGKGLKIALTVLDYGRTTFGASCTGAAKYCLRRSIHHANTRRQFGETLGSFEMVKEKLAYMAGSVFAMEACAYQTAALIDSGADDYMLETAMLKVFATECLWRIINDTIQIHGGMAYFSDEPFERMMRDARINMIGEGANDVLRAFIALVGMREVGLELQGLVNAIKNPFGNFGKLGGFAARRIGAMLLAPEVNVRTTELDDDATTLGRLVGSFGSHIERLLRRYREDVLDRQLLLSRVADSAIELYVSGCVLARLDQLLRDASASPEERRAGLIAGRYYLKTADRRVARHLADLWDNDDVETAAIANSLLSKHRENGASVS